jgi:hypothetical protein
MLPEQFCESRTRRSHCVSGLTLKQVSALSGEGSKLTRFDGIGTEAEGQV